jgi:serine protease Do
MKSGLLLFLGLLTIWTTPAGAISKSTESRIYKMTAAEAEEVCVEWLQKNGFSVFHQSQSDQIVDLLAEKEGQRLRIIAQRHSPIAAAVRIEAVQGHAQATVSALQQYLDGYINLPNHLPVREVRTIPEAVRQHVSAVVCLYSVEGDKEVQVTGFAVDTSGLILCTGHDLEAHAPISVMFSDGREIDGRVIKIDHLHDLALIQASSALENVIPLKEGRFMLQNGDPLFAISCPGGGLAKIESGFIDGPPRRVQGIPLWQAQMHIHHGSSGSPVFDGQGRVAAMVKGRYRGTDSIGFLIPFEMILQFLGKY